MSLSMFTDVMSTGLEALQFANIPPSLDQVLIANIDRSRLSNVTTFFLMKKRQDEGMNSHQRRDKLY